MSRKYVQHRNTIDVKHELINRISGIEDVDFLNAIKPFWIIRKKNPLLKYRLTWKMNS